MSTDEAVARLRQFDGRYRTLGEALGWLNDDLRAILDERDALRESSNAELAALATRNRELNDELKQAEHMRAFWCEGYNQAGIAMAEMRARLEAAEAIHLSLMIHLAGEEHWVKTQVKEYRERFGGRDE